MKKPGKTTLVRTTISLPESLYAKALERAKQLDFANFSDYLQHLLRKEVVFSESEEKPQHAKEPLDEVQKLKAS